MLRVSELNLAESQTADLFNQLGMEGLGLVTVDRKTGENKRLQKRPMNCNPFWFLI